jgi:hypothetical protein
MSDTFDTNLLSQVKPLDRKLSISKEFVGTIRKQKQGDHRKGNNFMMKQHEEGVHEERENAPSIDPADIRTIDITI